MTLERISQHIKDMEAITQYTRVMKERDDAISREKKLEDELAKTKNELNDRIRTLTSQNQALNNTLRDTKGELQTLSNSLKDREKELKTKNQAIDQARLESTNQKARIKELEELNVLAEGKTLSEVEKAVIKAKDQEIERRAQQKSLVITENWRTNDKQKEVETEALLQLDVILGLLAGQARYFPVALSKSNLLNMVQQALRREVDSRQWPQWFKTNVEPKAKDLESKIEQNVFTLLKGPWSIRCGVCGSEADHVLDAVLIESLIRNGFTRVQCVNPNCRNHGPLFAVRKTLIELINDYLTRPSGPTHAGP